MFLPPAFGRILREAQLAERAHSYPGRSTRCNRASFRVENQRGPFAVNAVGEIDAVRRQRGDTGFWRLTRTDKRTNRFGFPM